MRQKRMRRKKDRMKKKYAYLVAMLAMLGAHAVMVNKAEAKPAWADDNFLQYVNYSSTFSKFSNENDDYDESNLQANGSYIPKFPNNLTLGPKSTDSDEDGYALGGWIAPSDLPSSLVDPARMNQLEFKVDASVRIDDNDTMIIVTNGNQYKRTKDNNDTGMAKLYEMTSGWNPFRASGNSIQFVLDDVNTPLSRYERIKMSLADVVGPGLQSISVSNAGDGKFHLGETVEFVLHFDELVNIDTSFELPMNTGKKAVYFSGNGTKDIVFHYTVVADDMTRSDIGKQPYNQGRYLGIGTRAPSEWDLNQGGDDKIGAILPPNVKDLSDNEMLGSTMGNPYNWKSKYDANYTFTGGSSYYNQLDSSKIQVDGIVPVIHEVQVTTSTGTKYIKAGDKLTVKLLLDDVVSGTDGYITFNNGKKALYQSGSGSKVVTYQYVVQPEDEGNDLAYSNFIGHLGITDDYGNTPMIQNGYNPPLSLDGEAICVDAKLPTVLFQSATEGTTQRQHTVQLNVIEQGSGVKGDVLQYAWLQSPGEQNVTWVTYGIMDGKLPAISKSNTNGDWYVAVLLEDRAGNRNQITSPAIRFDNIQPVIAITPNGSGNQYLGSLTPQVNVTDENAGVDDAKLEYQWVYHDDEANELDWLPFQNGHPVQTPQFPEHGRYTLYVRAYDRAGNKSEAVTLPFYLDTKPPEINMTPDGNLTQQRMQKAQISAVDANSNLKSLMYGWSQDADPKNAAWKELGSRREVSTDDEEQRMEGVWFLHVRASDIWGNEAFQSRAFYVDNTPPAVVFQYAPSVTATVKEAVATVRAKDANTISALYYQWTASETKPGMTDASWLHFANGSKLSKNNVDGDWFLHIKAVDSFGNKSITTSRVFKLSHSAPKSSDFQMDMPTHTNADEVKIQISAPSKETYTYHIEDQNQHEIQSGEITDGSTALTLEMPANEGTYTYSFSFENEVRNRSDKMFRSIIVDKTLSVAEVVYSETAQTRNPVIVQLTNLYDNETLASELQLPDGETHTFKENGSYTFKIVDKAGNERLIPVQVTNIDNVMPNIRIAAGQGQQPSRTVSAAVYAEDNRTAKGDLHLYAQWTPTESAPDLSDANWKAIANEAFITESELESGEWFLHVKAVDQVGNTSVLTSDKLIVDRNVPFATIVYSTVEPTANTVTAHVTFDKPGVRILNTPGGIPFYTFSGNGSFTFEFEDEAGNRSSALATVDQINPVLPKADISFSTTDITYQDVLVKMATTNNRFTLADFMFEAGMGEQFVSSQSDGLAVTESVYSIAQNGLISFVIRDRNGEVADQPVKVPVWNIDKKAPSATLRYSSSNWTRSGVGITLQLADESPTVILNNHGSNTFTLEENGQFTFEFQDAAGNRSSITAEVTHIDNEAPTASLSYSTTEPTNKPVTVTLLAADNSGAPVSIMNNGGQASYTFTENGTFSFIIRDQAGNESVIPVEVTNIDKRKPTGSVVYSTKALTNEDVVAQLLAIDDLGEPVTVTSGGGSQATFKQNGVFTFTFQDRAGNEGTVVAGVNWIDKTPPRGTITASETNPTQQDVVLTLDLPEGGDIINHDGKSSIVATENGDYTFKVADTLGNTADITYRVDNIDRKAPIGQIVYNTDGPTNQDVIATVIAGEDFKVLNNHGSKQVVFKENGEFVFDLQDEAGNTSSVKATVNRIDRTAPIVTIKYSATKLTNQSVTASVYSEEGGRLIAINNDEKTSLVFKENGAFTFIVTDEAGNRVRALAKVQNIDKSPPIIKFAKPYMIFEPGEEIVLNDFEAYDDRDGAIAQDRVTLKPPEVDASTGGTYVVTYSTTDEAGNTAEVKRPVQVLTPQDFLVLVNGKFEPSSQYMVEGYEVTFKVVNFIEQYKADFKKGDGMLKSGDFKQNTTDLEHDVTEEPVAKEVKFTAKQPGWHTFYFQDLNRRTVVINIYFLGGQ
ncbi:Ig-like domain repeat protein [Paenibacillus sp. P36]|uniref:Ig-like domain repeat protein n=1 Tax=Paenibacillus sp. P36 TaxID=3342538 RepID=UPI0038B3688B